MATNALYRLAGAAGIASAVVLLVNVARRTDLLPTNQATHGIAPLAVLLGGFALTGLYLWQRRESGALGTTGYALNAAGIVGVFGIEFTLNNVFPYLTRDTITALVA